VSTGKKMGRKQWPLEVHQLQEMIDNGLDVKDLEVKDLLILILNELRIVNKHLFLITDEEIDYDY